MRRLVLRTLRVWPKNPFDKEIIYVTHRLTQPSLQEARNRDEIILVQSLPVGVKVDRKYETK